MLMMNATTIQSNTENVGRHDVVRKLVNFCQHIRTEGHGSVYENQMRSVVFAIDKRDPRIN